MARVIRFDPSFQQGEFSADRLPRFEEIGAQVDAQAAKLFDSEAALARNRELYARLEARLAHDDKPLLRELYEAITSYQEKYEQAAYLVGLRAASGHLEGLPPVLKDDRSEEPEPA